jgi:hypothetical protein
VERVGEKREEDERRPPKIAPGRKLPKPAVPHVYVKTGLGFGIKVKLPPER